MPIDRKNIIILMLPMLILAGIVSVYFIYLDKQKELSILLQYRHGLLYYTYPTGLTTDSLVLPNHSNIQFHISGKTGNQIQRLESEQIGKQITVKDSNTYFIKTRLSGTLKFNYTNINGSRVEKNEIIAQITSSRKYKTFLEATLKAQKERERPISQGALLGKALLKQHNCTSCHSTDGAMLIAPTFKDLFGARVAVHEQNNKLIERVVDSQYVVESVLDPDLFITKGYTFGTMPTYQEKLNAIEIEQIISYLKHISSQN